MRTAAGARAALSIDHFRAENAEEIDAPGVAAVRTDRVPRHGRAADHQPATARDADLTASRDGRVDDDRTSVDAHTFGTASGHGHVFESSFPAGVDSLLAGVLDAHIGDPNIVADD